MNETRRLADQLERTLNGDAWYGPSWREALDGIGLAAALQKPVPNAHSIAELVLHATTWHDVVRRRLEGETPDVGPEQDWPRAAFASESEWAAAIRRLFETGKALADTIARLPDSRLEEERPKQAGTWFNMVAGIVEHDAYHAGQVGLLRKAAVPVAA